MPERIREVIRREQRHLKAELPRARWTRPEGQHLTLKFLGETPAENLARLKKEIIRPGGRHARGHGSPRRRRVLPVDPTAAGRLDRWRGRGRSRGRRCGGCRPPSPSGFPRERRPWSLHLTQARLDRGWPRSAVERFLEWGRGLELEPFTCREVVLFASELRPGGAVYTPLERFPLE